MSATVEIVDMRIAILHYRLLRKGGLESRLLNYIDAFVRRGHSVTVFCAKADPEIQLPEGVRIHKVSLGLMPNPFRKWYFSRQLAKYATPDAFDFRLSLGRTDSQDAVLAPGNHKGYVRSLGKKWLGISDRIQTYLDTLSFERSKLIFAASELIADELSELYHLEGEKIRILYPPLNTKRFNPELKSKQVELKLKLGLDPDKRSLAFVSISHSRKGLPLLTEVFRKLINAPFELIVAGESFRSPLPNIKYLGMLENPEELYAAADLTVHPAIYEPFGQVISESLACQTPVMVSHMVGAKSIISDKEGIIIPSFDPQEWLKAIRRFPEQNFEIPPDFADQHRLSLEDHVDFMLEEWNALWARE